MTIYTLIHWDKQAPITRSRLALSVLICVCMYGITYTGSQYLCIDFCNWYYRGFSHKKKIWLGKETRIQEAKVMKLPISEKENIWTFDSKGELLITIMSSLAQEESRSISETALWPKKEDFLMVRLQYF